MSRPKAKWTTRPNELVAKPEKDGTFAATTDCPAVALADDAGAVPSYLIGSRVRVQIRNPHPPVVEGKETT